ncbi:MAG: glycosyltransferase family 2 protein [Bacteriovoracaceae bacterium]|nr:glycosyltransferase family 2 protein [Bacteriovoracaceae bacterium]
MEDYKSPHVSIILPVYNEENSLPIVVRDIRRSMENANYNYEILAVDDGSTDSSQEKAQILGVRLLPSEVNMGAGHARKRGIRAALGKVVVFLDADSTYDSSDIPRLLDWTNSYDQVNGARDTDQGSLVWLRVSVKFLLRMLASLFACQYIPDLNTGLKALNREVLLKYIDLIPNGFSCVTTMTLSFMVTGHKVKYVPTKYKPRIGKSKFHPIKDTFNLIRAIFRTVWKLRPERMIFFFLMIFYIVFAICTKSSINKAIHSSYAFTLYFVVSLLSGYFLNRKGHSTNE